MRYCVNCGEPLEDEDRFCPDCGAKQPEAATEESPAEETLPAVSGARGVVPNDAVSIDHDAAVVDDDGVVVCEAGQFVYKLSDDYESVVITGLKTQDKGAVAKVVVPGVIEEMPVKSIAADAFDNCGAREIELLDGITVIPARLFAGLEQLRRVKLPQSVCEIGNSAFIGCAALEEVDIPDGVAKMGNSMFKDCIALRSIKLPPQMHKIGNHMFDGCSALESVNIPDGVSAIGDKAFNSCIALSSISIPSSVTAIGEGAFSGCTALKAVDLPATKIAKDAFNGCTALETVIFQNGAGALIEDGAFAHCTALKTVQGLTGQVKFGGDVSSILGSGSSLPYFGFSSRISHLMEAISSGDISLIDVDNITAQVNGTAKPTAFLDCPSLSLKSQAMLRKAGYRGEF